MSEFFFWASGIIIGGIVSAYFFFKSKKEPRPFFAVVSDRIFHQSELDEIEGARVVVGRTNRQCIVKTEIYLFNIGRSEIVGSDIAQADPLRVTSSIGVALNEPTVWSNRRAVNANITQDGLDWIVSFDVLAPSDVILVRFFTETDNGFVPPVYSVFQGDLKSRRVQQMRDYEFLEGPQSEAWIQIWPLLWISGIIAFGSLLWEARTLTVEQIFGSWDFVEVAVGSEMVRWFVPIFVLVAMIATLARLSIRFRYNLDALRRVRNHFTKSGRS